MDATPPLPNYPPPPPRPDYRPHRGPLILVLGILSLMMCGLLGIAAWIMGNNDLQEIRAGRMDPEGEGLTNAGRIMGMIGLLLTLIPLLFLMVILLIMVVAGGAAAMSHG